MCSCCAVEFADENPRSFVIMEAIFYYVRFCVDSQFTFEPSRNVLEIMQIVFVKCIFTSAESSAEEAVALFKDEVSGCTGSLVW